MARAVSMSMSMATAQPFTCIPTGCLGGLTMTCRQRERERERDGEAERGREATETDGHAVSCKEVHVIAESIFMCMVEATDTHCMHDCVWNRAKPCGHAHT